MLAKDGHDGLLMPMLEALFKHTSGAVKLVRAMGSNSPTDCHNLGGDLDGRGLSNYRGEVQASGRKGEISTSHGRWLLTAFKQIGPQETLAMTIPTDYGNRLASYIKQVADLTTRIL